MLGLCGKIPRTDADGAKKFDREFFNGMGPLVDCEPQSMPKERW
jgi:hypothetical protein